MSEFDVYVTITGLNKFPGCRRLYENEKLVLCREPENEVDKDAVAAYGHNGKLGYVANSKNTVREGTFSASKLCEVMETSAKATVIEGTYHDALCRVEDVFDHDKVILKAYHYYDLCEYEAALELFLMLCDKYNSVLLLQKTADCYIKLEKFERALPYVETALKSEPLNKTSLMMSGFVLEKLGSYKNAIKQYQKISELCENQKVEEALKRCKELLEK